MTVKQEQSRTKQYNRIIEWFGLEGTLKIIWVQPPCHGQGHPPLDQVAQSPIQPGLEPVIAEHNQFFRILPVKRCLFSYYERQKSSSDLVNPKFLFLLPVVLPAVYFMIGFPQEYMN